jgi:hypothetical protein
MEGKMTKLEYLTKIRELIRAEVEVGIAGVEEDEDGYRGNNKHETREADRIFEELLNMV